VVLDEIGDQNPKIWNEVIRPALADRNTDDAPTWCLFIGTPKGKNHFADFRDRAKAAEDWCLLEFKASQTGILSEKELWAARKEMGDDRYFQEFECSFDAAIEGSYFGQIINDLEAKSGSRLLTGMTFAGLLLLGILVWAILLVYGWLSWLARKLGLSTASKTTESVWTGMYRGSGTISTKALHKYCRTMWR
jgi:hypothetical protein